ncbi:olfactomedin-like protein 2B [Echeneis naucrates]|uniref:Olfactomedin-like protein 2B n=1 Tax=Echeneis naucrates TaxID=173247 RepID=A0A665W8U6_ECHNA|nr:olfactomedin-like protein 2B [Echeneis naucrates]
MSHMAALLLLCWTVNGFAGLKADGDSDSPPQKMPVTEVAAPAEPDQDAPSAAERRRDASEWGAERLQQPLAEPLEDELDNQENIISQLLDDYDKVKTVSSGSDCVCRCIVQPIKRSDCSRSHDTDAPTPSQEFYTVETVTKGTDCKKCECMAPPSAVNPYEGEYRFKKLQEASKDDIKLATIMDLLEGSLYGVDLLKLHSVTTKLLARMDNMEKAFISIYSEKQHVKERAKDKEKEKKTQQKKKKANDMPNLGQKGHSYNNKQKNYEGHGKRNQQQDGLEQQQPTKNKTGTQKSVKDKTEPRQPVKDKSSVVIRGVTYYKAEEESFKEDERGNGKNTTLTEKASVDLLISHLLPLTRTSPKQNPGPALTARTDKESLVPEFTPGPTQQPSDCSTTTKAAPTTIDSTTKMTTTTKLITTSLQTATLRAQPTTPAAHHSTSVPDTTETSPTAAPGQAPKSRLSWTESPADQPKTTKKPGVCKDTVASLSDPVQHNSYGLTEGAWMKDARGHGNVIYLTSGHYGNNLLEFRDMDTFKSGQVSNTYKLPYSFTGTGHVVFNGAFYYNRAFSRDVIKYDLRHRYVAAWTTLHDAILEEQAQRTQTEVEFAVDESGLWLLYPAVDTEGFHQEVILLTHLRSRDLMPVRSFRTGLRRGHFGNSFLVCGVLYGVDSMARHYANVTYAFDTHTLTHTVPSLAFTNMYSHTSQLAYFPLDKKLYAWDNGHQMTYDVIFAY